MPEQILLISLVAFVASILTFFSGFGLGTLLLPVFGLFFPIEVAVAATGVVHFCNNLFKLTLTGKNIVFPVLLRFGIPSIAGAFLGAYLFSEIKEWSSILSYSFAGNTYAIHPLKLIIALLMICFAVFELVPFLSKLKAPASWAIPGGLISGFFGGLSGHQGALRSLFLVKMIPAKEAFIATGIAIACLVDITRIPVYFSIQRMHMVFQQPLLIICPVVLACTGAIIGNRLLKKITFPFLQKFVVFGIILFAVCLGSGIL